MNLYNDGLTIGELSHRTGIGVSTLRAWERRHGFPVPERRSSGHRRYSERDAAALEAVLRERRDGVTLEAALRHAKTLVDAPRTSVFATLRDALAGTQPSALSKGAMLALSHCIEDEAAAHADGPVFVGAFQAKRFLARSRRRWQQIAVRSELTVALATGLPARAAGRFWQVPIDKAAPLAGEWAVVCDSPSFAACVVGVERPLHPGAARRFDALWTVEPQAVRAALRAALALAAAESPGIAAAVPARVRAPAVATYDTLRAATVLTNRVIAYLDPLRA